MLRPLLAVLICSSLATAVDGWPNIPRKLPPVGKELPEADAKRLRTAVDELAAAVAKQSAPLIADVAIFAKAVDLALRLRVHLLMEALKAEPLAGLEELAPGVRSLQLRYDSRVLHQQSLLPSSALPPLLVCQVLS